MTETERSVSWLPETYKVHDKMTCCSHIFSRFLNQDGKSLTLHARLCVCHLLCLEQWCILLKQFCWPPRPSGHHWPRQCETGLPPSPHAETRSHCAHDSLQPTTESSTWVQFETRTENQTTLHWTAHRQSRDWFDLGSVLLKVVKGKPKLDEDISSWA